MVEQVGGGERRCWKKDEGEAADWVSGVGGGAGVSPSLV